MTETWRGKAFAPVFYRAMAEWNEGGEVGPDPRMEIEQWSDESWQWLHCDADSLMRGVGGFFRWKPTPKRTVTINGKELVATEVEAQPTTALLQQALEALEPFFADAERVHPDWASERRRSSLSQDKPVTVGDFRKAHAAYLSVEAALAAGVREAQPRKLSESEVGKLPCGYHRSEQEAIDSGLSWLRERAGPTLPFNVKLSGLPARSNDDE